MTGGHVCALTVLPKKKPKMYAKQSLHTTIPHGSVNLEHTSRNGVRQIERRCPAGRSPGRAKCGAAHVPQQAVEHVFG